MREINCIRDEDESSQSLRVALILSDLIASTPNVTTFEFLSSFTAVALLQLPTTSREQIQQLSIAGEPLSARVDHAATLVLGFPNLHSVWLEEIEADVDGAPLLLSALQQLPMLEYLELMDCDAFRHSPISWWRGPVNDLYLYSNLDDSLV